MEPEVVSDQAIEDKLAASFERAEAPHKEPQQRDEPEAIAEEPTDEPQEEVTAEAEGEETQPDEVVAEEEGYEETEYEGKSYKLPKELKEALMRHKDYTQGKQEAAEMKRFAEEERQSLQAERAFQQKHFAKAVEGHTLQQKLQQFAQVDWMKLADENPAEAIKLHTQHVALQQQFAAVKEEMQSLNAQFQQEAAELRQKAQAQCIQELKRNFPDLADPEKGKALLGKLNETGLSFGFTGRELEGIVDPRMIRVLHAAMQWKSLQASKSVVEKKVQTAKPVQVQAARTSQSTQRNAKFQDLKARAIKTGRPSDTEAFLEAAFSRKR
jgi:hypothetical protein